MVFANKLASPAGWPVITLVVCGLLVVACTSQKPVAEPTSKSQVVLESRSSLLNWHDVTHKSYYGLKGPVKRLIVKPVLQLDGSSQAVSEEWQYDFNQNGRLLSKVILDGSGFKTFYSYTEEGYLLEVTSYKKSKVWRTSTFVYENGDLVKIQYADNDTREQIYSSVSRQSVSDGWFEIQKPITMPGLPLYSQFLKDNTLIWSNRGDINNGLGELYYIRTVDSVTSSSVANNGTDHMQGLGGYRYYYDDNGLLKSVESYNGNANRLFHKTTYEYNDLNLLMSENRVVSDVSNFNQAINEEVNYVYQNIDVRGNWTARTLLAKAGFQTQKYSETREIEYFTER